MAERKRVALSVPPELNQKLSALAAVRGCATSVLTRQILTEYLEKHEDEVKEATELVSKYRASIEEYRAGKTSD